VKPDGSAHSNGCPSGAGQYRFDNRVAAVLKKNKYVNIYKLAKNCYLFINGQQWNFFETTTVSYVK